MMEMIKPTSVRALYDPVLSWHKLRDEIFGGEPVLLPLDINTAQDTRDGISGNSGKQTKPSVHHGAAGGYLKVERYDEHYLELSTTSLGQRFLRVIPQVERQPVTHPRGTRLQSLGAQEDAVGRWARVPGTVLQIGSKYQIVRTRKKESKQEDVSKALFVHLYQGRLKNW